METNLSFNEILGLRDSLTMLQTPHDITLYLILTILGVVFLILLFKNERVTKFFLSGKSLVSQDEIKNPYDAFDEIKLKSILDRLTNNYRILLAVYGILLAFVVSDKISYSLISWNFLIWSGYVLGVIMKAGWNLVDLTDIMERNPNKASRIIFRNKEFFRHTLILLAVAIAFLPAMTLVEQPTKEYFDSLPWKHEVSILSGAFGILSIAFLFFMILHLYETDNSQGIFSIYAYPALLFIFGNVSSWGLQSPIQPKLVSIGGFIQGEIPQIFVTAVSFGTTAIGMMVWGILAVINAKYQKRKERNAKSKISTKDQ